MQRPGDLQTQSLQPCGSCSALDLPFRTPRPRGITMPKMIILRRVTPWLVFVLALAGSGLADAQEQKPEPAPTESEPETTELAPVVVTAPPMLPESSSEMMIPRRTSSSCPRAVPRTFCG